MTAGSAVSDLVEFGMLRSLARNVLSYPHLCGDDINSVRLKHLPALTIIKMGLTAHPSKIRLAKERPQNAKKSHISDAWPRLRKQKHKGIEKSIFACACFSL